MRIRGLCDAFGIKLHIVHTVRQMETKKTLRRLMQQVQTVFKTHFTIIFWPPKISVSPWGTPPPPYPVCSILIPRYPWCELRNNRRSISWSFRHERYEHIENLFILFIYLLPNCASSLSPLEPPTSSLPSESIV